MKIIFNLVACVCCCLALAACESSQDVNAGAMSECGVNCDTKCCSMDKKKCAAECAKECCDGDGAVNAVNPGAVSDQTCPYSGAKMGAMSEKSSCCSKK